MNALIRASLSNPYAVAVVVMTTVLLGVLTVIDMPKDILPVNKSPAVQVLTFYGGMPADNIEKDVTNRMERWTGQAAGTRLQESRSIVGASIIRNYYTSDIDPNGALTQVNSLASAAIPNLPPGTLPPVILPFDPTGTTPVCLVALNSRTQSEAMLYDVGRYEVRNFIMAQRGAVAPVVYGGKLRAVIAYLNRDKLASRNMSPVEVMDAIERFNVFLPTGFARFGSTYYALDSNSMFEFVEGMGDIPLRVGRGQATYLRDVAEPKDSSLIQTNLVRVDGRRQVYIPVYRQAGSSTLDVVENVKKARPGMEARVSQPDIKLEVVMDQSVYVRSAITGLTTEGLLGAVLCSLVILVFLGEWRLTVIAVMTIPIAVLGGLIALGATNNTINVMTLAGLSLAIGPLVDSAIICLENTHRHLSLGAQPREAAFRGASEVALPELVATLCLMLVLAPLALMAGTGKFLFQPMALAVAFSMIAAYLLSRSFVPALCALWLRPHVAHGPHPPRGVGAALPPPHAPGPGHAEHENVTHTQAPPGLFARWEAFLNQGIIAYSRLLDRVIERPLVVLGGATVVLVAVLTALVPNLRREFFPEVDAGAFEIQVRAPTGTSLPATEQRIELVEEKIRSVVEDDLQLIISEVGVTADWSAAYTPNAGTMDAVVRVQLKEHRARSAQEHVAALRSAFIEGSEFNDLEFSFDAGGMIRGAMNEGKSTPLNVRITGKNMAQARKVAEKALAAVREIDGVVDARILQRRDYPQYFLDVDRVQAARLGLTQTDVMRNVVAALNSSILFNKRNFWIDPKTHNQYFVGVQYPETDIKSIETLLQIPITSPAQEKQIPLANLVTIKRTTVPAELTHTNLQATIDLSMGVAGRDLGHVADAVAEALNGLGRREKRGEWVPYDPDQEGGQVEIEGAAITLSGEYSRMQETLNSFGRGLILASLLVYFLMVALFKSWLVPLVILSAVPFGLVGVVLALFLTGTALNIQSLLGVIFMVGIVVSNTVLMIDYAQNLRRSEGLSPREAIRRAASVRVRPVVMTALAAFFSLLPMALGLERGSEANTPLGRAVMGGLIAGLVTTLFVVPTLYALVVPDQPLVGPAENGNGNGADVVPPLIIDGLGGL
jgi:multidrug efflux pump subunit AcrB